LGRETVDDLSLVTRAKRPHQRSGTPNNHKPIVAVRPITNHNDRRNGLNLAAIVAAAEYPK
jgi:hypothetical protein